MRTNRISSVKFSIFLLASLLLTAAWFTASAGYSDYDPSNQSENLTYNEAQTVYLGNLARQNEAGLPPLRWNQQLTYASRWFSWDSVENRAEPYCGHQDTLGGLPSDRAPIFGYLGGAGAENAFCGYVTPQQAIDGWLNSPGHRANLLAEGHREIGLGYYLRDGDGRGYVAQMFGADVVYPPVVIENEALATTDATVDLYIYDRSAGGGFAGLAPATEMRVGNNPCFTGATWEPYTDRKSWNLNGGNGWKSVYVQTVDAFGRTISVADSIYLGANVPLGEIGPEQMSSTEPDVTLYNLDVGSWPRAQFSLGWLADDSNPSFTKWWGNGEAIADANAWGGTTYRLFPGDGESFAWVYDTGFFKETPLVAYFRLKVNNNSSTSEVARISVKGGGVEYGPISLKGTDFTAVNQYQEFALPFTFHDDSADPFLIFQIWRSGAADLFFDAVSIFTPPQAFSTTETWAVPGGNYRGQGVWVRYTNESGTTFSNLMDATTNQGALAITPTAITLLTQRNGSTPPPIQLTVQALCGDVAWQVSDDASWLSASVNGQTIAVQVNQAGLANGSYLGTVTVTAVGLADSNPIEIPVQLIVADAVYHTHLPLIKR